MEYLTQFLSPALLTLIVVAAYLLADKALAKFLPKTTIETLGLLAGIAVKSAEQLSIIGQLNKEDRKQYALDLIKIELKSRGIKFDIEVMIAAIEAAVLEVNKLR